MDKLSLIGLHEQKIKETRKNATLTNSLESIIDQVLKENNGSINKEQAKLIYSLATKLPKQCNEHSKLLTTLISSSEIDQEAKLTAAIKFIQGAIDGKVNIEELKKCCGVGVTVSQDEIEEAIQKIVKANKSDICAQRY